MTPAARNYIFWIAAFAAILGIVVAMSAMMSVYSSRQMISKEVSALQHFVSYAARNHLSEIAFLPPYNKMQKNGLTMFFQDVRRDSEVRRVRIWLEDGSIKPDTGNMPVFTENTPDAWIRGALEKQAFKLYRFVPGDEPAADDSAGGRNGKKAAADTDLSILVPLRSEFSGKVNAVVEIVESASVVLMPLRRVQIMIWIITFLGLGLYPTLLILANYLYRKRKEHEIELIKAKQLEAINSMIVTFNHEVNQPLTGICTYAELLRKAATSDENLIRFADKIHEQSVRLGNLVQKISEITRVETTEYLEGTAMIDLAKSAGEDDAGPPKEVSPPE